jgi:hypothetical protein
MPIGVVTTASKALPLADRGDDMTAATSAPPHANIAVFPGVYPDPMRGTHRPHRPERVHHRILCIVGDRYERRHRIGATGGEDALP